MSYCILVYYIEYYFDLKQISGVRFIVFNRNSQVIEYMKVIF